MTIRGFLKIPDIPGESAHVGHEQEIEVHAVAFNMEVLAEADTGMRRRRPSVSSLTCYKYYDMSSPYLKKALFENRRLDEVVFTAQRTAEGKSRDYLAVTLTDGSVVRYDMSSPSDVTDLIEEELAFEFRAIKFTYDGRHEVTLAPHQAV